MPFTLAQSPSSDGQVVRETLGHGKVKETPYSTRSEQIVLVWVVSVDGTLYPDEAGKPV